MFEIGKPVAPSPLPKRLLAHPVVVRPYGPQSRPRFGLAVSDGVSADRMRLTGKKSIARDGERQRKDLLSYLSQRCAAGARPCFAFVFFEGMVEEAILDASCPIRIGEQDFSSRLVNLSIGTVAEFFPTELDEPPAQHGDKAA